MEETMTTLKSLVLGLAIVGGSIAIGNSASWAQGKIYSAPTGPAYGSADQPAQLGPRQGGARPQAQPQQPPSGGSAQRRGGDDGQRSGSGFDRGGGRGGMADRDYDRRGGGYRSDYGRRERW